MTKKNQTPAQILETVRGERDMTKGDFAEALGITRQWYDQVLNGKDIDLKTLAYLAVDHANDWRGTLANQLIEIVHGPQMVPMGSQQELLDLREYLRKCNYEDLSGMTASLARGHFPLWAAELQTRLNEHLAAVKAQIAAEAAK